jgi:hypothetical protein
MIEVHRTGRESPPAIGTRHIAKLVEEAGVLLPAGTLPIEVSRRSVSEACRYFDMRGAGAQSMAVRAHDVALVYLSEQAGSRHQHRAALGYAEQFVCLIPVVEIHLMRLEDHAALGAGSLPEIPQQREGRCLASAHPLNLAFAIPPVVGDVGRTLAEAQSHRSL